MTSEQFLAQPDGVAIIGMACRFPGAATIDAFWDNLRNGVESISFFDDAELASSGVSPELLKDESYVKARGILEGADLFDAAFFGYSPRDAQVLNPQFRVFLECSWEALENAGYSADRYEGAIGVFAGAGANDYLYELVLSGTLPQSVGEFQLRLANEKDFLPTIVSYKLNLKGPSVSIQTACSTSLVAIHFACQSLINGECDVALAGGVSITTLRKQGYIHQEGGIASPDGHCRAFDANAQGTVTGNGVGIVVLKRLSEAIEEGDHISAVITGSAINNDGCAKIGFTAPSVEGQARVISEALAVAGVEPDTVSYVEAHGTATPLGDPIELQALKEVFQASTVRKQFCAIGSVKTNFGHLDAAAGVAGLIKTVLALKHRAIPPSLHFKQPNPELDLAGSPFFVNDKLKPWKPEAGILRAGVSSFGIGGTNAHVVVEEAPAPGPSGGTAGSHLLLISAKSPEALETATTNLREYFRQGHTTSLADIAYTLQVGRKHFDHRRVAVGRDGLQVLEMLEGMDPRKILSGHSEGSGRSAVFVFSGQGTQYVGMGRGLYEGERVFRETVDECAEYLERVIGRDIRGLVYPVGVEEEEAEEKLKETYVTQPVLFTIEYALARQLMEWGVKAEALIGHSIGEYVAGCLSGVFTLREGLGLVAARGRLMQMMAAGGMLAVPLSEEEARRYTGNGVSLGAINGPKMSVLSGETEALREVQRRLNETGAVSKWLETSHAFHSEMMEPMLEEYRREVERIRLKRPKVGFISNVSGDWIKEEEATDPGYWVRQLREPVRFSEGLRRVVEESPRIVIEVGPGQTLASSLRQLDQMPPQAVAVTTMRHRREKREDSEVLMEGLGKGWLAGLGIDWDRLYEGQRRSRVPLPTYPFQRKRFWLDEKARTRQEKTVEQQSFTQSAKEDVGLKNALTDTTTTNSEIRRARIVEELKQIIAELSGTEGEPIDVHATFFELGAESLLLLQASQAIQTRLGVKVPFRLMIEAYSTVDSLASYIEGQLPDTDASPLMPDKAPEETVVGDVSAAPGLPELSEFQVPHAQQPIASAIVARSNGGPDNRAPGEHLYSSIPEAAPGLGFEHILSQQIQLMSQQLELMRDGRARLEGVSAGIASKSEPAVQPSSPMRLSAPESTPHTSPGNGNNPVTLSEQLDPEPYSAYQSISKDAAAGLSAIQRARLEALISSITRKTPNSKRHADQYRPVHADSTTTAGFRLLWKELVYPIIADRGVGSKVWDIDGNEYLDLSMGFGSLLFGHSPSFVMDAIRQELERGVRLCYQSETAGKVAALICELTGAERVAFCNSGTEAVMSAIRLARAATGRPKIALFVDSYHGTFDEVLVRAEKRKGSGWHAFPLAPGIADHLVQNVIVLSYDSKESLDTLAAHAGELAAVLVEPPQSRRPDVQPKQFLQEVRRLTESAGIALIFDEVVDGFRPHPGGSQALLDVRADIVTYGKAVASGMPIGVIAGKARYMDAIDGGEWRYGDASMPEAVTTFFTGTFFKHPLVMAAAYAVLSHLKEQGPQLQETLNEKTTNLVNTINLFFESCQLPIRAAHFGSLFRLVYPRHQLRFMELFFYYMLDKGIFFADTRTCFLSTAHSDQDITRFVEALKTTVWEMQEAGFLPSPVPPPPRGNTKGLPTADPDRGIQGQTLSRNSEGISSGPGSLTGRNSLPTTEGQRQMWIVHQMGGDAAIAYNESIALHLTGPLNLEALRIAIQRVVDRHEALRLTFSPDGSRAFISPVVRARVPLVDLSKAESADLQTGLLEWLRSESRILFDLKAGPLFRMALARISGNYHVLAITVHHLVNDARSFELMLKELSVFYRAECESSPPTIGAPAQFSDFAERQARETGALSGSDAEAYWIRQFADYNPVLNIPADFLRPPVRSFAGVRECAAIPAQAADSLKRLATRLGCSFFTLLLGGYSIFLSKLCGQDDVVVGIAAANESPADDSTLMGYRMNLLPIRSRVSGAASLAAYLTSLRCSVIDAIEHQSYPFGVLVEKLRIAANSSRAGLVSAGFNLDRAGPLLNFHDVQVRVQENYNSTAKFDIFVNVTDAVDGLSFECVCNADLVSQETVRRWLQHLTSLVTLLPELPDRLIMDVPMLSRSEEHEILTEWNNTVADYPSDSNPQELFELQVERSPDSIALSCGDSHLGYQELNRRSNRLARFLMRLGVGPEVLVGIFAEPGIGTIVNMIAVWKAGGAYLPLDPNQPGERLHFIVENSGSRFLLSSAGGPALIGGPRRNVLRLRERSEEIERESDENPLGFPGDPRQAAYAIYTSGSTGLPKGVLLEHRGLCNLVAAVIRCFGLDRNSRVLQFAPLTFDASVFEIAPALFGGAQLCLWDGEGRLVPDGNLTAWLEDHSITAITMPPSALSVLPQVRLGGLKSIVSAGEACTMDVVAKWMKAATLYNAYGPTEATVWSSIKECTTSEPPSIGRPIANTRMYILDGYLEAVAVGVSGELYISGAGLARGYLNGAGLTAEKFIPEGFSGKAGERMYRSGDIGKHVEGGEIEYGGRKDQQVKVRGYRIELGEIESALMKHPEIGEAVVMIGEGVGGEKRLEAYVVVNGGNEMYVNEIRKYLEGKIPEYMIPGRYVRIEEMPRLTSGKVDRGRLKKGGGREVEREGEYEEARTGRERVLGEIWREVLGVEKVGVHDNFFELGGDSIMSIQIVSRANERGIRLTAKEIFTNQTIAELAAVGGGEGVEGGREVVGGVVVEGIGGEEVELTPIQRWFFEQGLEEPHHWNQSMMYEVRGEMDTRRLEGAIGAVARHHEALRLRFRREEGEWRQYIGEEGSIGVTEVDLTGVVVGEGEYKELLDRAQGSLNIEVGPLMRVVVFRREAGIYKVLMVVHHLAIDVVSWGILSEDLQVGYERIGRGEPVKLAGPTTRYGEWSERLVRLAESEEIGREREYWERELGRETERLPVDREGENDERSARSVRGVLTGEETEWLMREVPKIYKTRIGEVLLAALGEAIWEWSGIKRVKVDLESHGRESLFDDVDLSRTIGWFTSIYPVVLDIGGDEPLVHRLEAVKRQVRQVPNGGIGYGLVRYLRHGDSEPSSLQALPRAQLCLNYVGGQRSKQSASASGSPAAPEMGRPHSPLAIRPYLLEVNAFIQGASLCVDWFYSGSVYHPATIAGLSRSFIDAIRALIKSCKSDRTPAFTPDDFTEFKWSKSDIEARLAAIETAKQGAMK